MNNDKYEHTHPVDWQLGLTTSRNIREGMFTEVMYKKLKVAAIINR